MHNFNRGIARVLGERERFIYRQCGPGAAGAAEHCSKPSISISPYSVQRVYILAKAIAGRPICYMLHGGLHVDPV